RMLSVFFPSFFRSSSVCAPASAAAKSKAAAAKRFMRGLPRTGAAMLRLDEVPAQEVRSVPEFALTPDSLQGGRHVVVARRVDGHRPTGRSWRGRAQGPRAPRRP